MGFASVTSNTDLPGKESLQKEWKVGYLRVGFSVRQSISVYPCTSVAKLLEEPEFGSIASLDNT